MFVFLKLLSPAYRKRRERVLRFRGIKPSKRRFFRNPMSSYWWVFENPRPGENLRLTNLKAPANL